MQKILPQIFHFHIFAIFEGLDFITIIHFPARAAHLFRDVLFLVANVRRVLIVHFLLDFVETSCGGVVREVVASWSVNRSMSAFTSTALLTTRTLGGDPSSAWGGGGLPSQATSSGFKPDLTTHFQVCRPFFLGLLKSTGPSFPSQGKTS